MVRVNKLCGLTGRGISRVEVTVVAMMVELVLVRWLSAWNKF